MERVPFSVFDAGVGADFDEVHVHLLNTPDGQFVTDGAALIFAGWCDDLAQGRATGSVARDVDPDWWRRATHTTRSNIVDGYPQVTVRPFYELTLTAAGGRLEWRSDAQEAVIVHDEHRKVRGLIGGVVTPYSPRALSEHLVDVTHLMEVYRRQVPTLHPHLAAMAALIAVDEREGGAAQQLRPDVVEAS